MASGQPEALSVRDGAAPYVIAIIPARGGSKRIPGKNLVPLAGIPLVAYSIRRALASSFVREVYVSPDDADIESVSNRQGARVIRRPAQISSDEATSESALLHVLEERARQGHPECSLVVFLQATSPLRRADDIDSAVRQFLDIRADSLFSACENNRLVWALKDGQPYSVSYDYRKRQREQDMAVQYRENGSIYVLRPDVLRRFNNRLGGRIAVYAMDYWSSFQIDSPEHLELFQWLVRRPEFRLTPDWPDRIELVVFDFDGVMTDNTVEVSTDGSEAVRCNRADGLGISRLQRRAVGMMVVSTEENQVVSARCAKLGIACHQGIDDKAEYLRRYFERERVDPAKVVYLGNDINDLGAMRLTGFPVAVADAHPEVLLEARWVLTCSGGYGAVRELCDLIELQLETGTARA